MHEQRQEEEVEAVDLGQQGGKAPLPGKVRLAQGMHVIDHQEGVLVDGVAMIRVADDQGVDAVELGDEQLQDAQRMHGAQRVRGVGPEQNFAQTVPQEGSFGDVHIEHRERVGKAVFGVLRQPVAMRRNHGEDAENSFGAGEQRRFGDIDAAILDHEVGAWNRGALASLGAVERLSRRGQSLHEQDRAAIDRARMAVIRAHPVGGIGGAFGFEADALGGGFVLRMPIEAVVVAAAAEVEKAARGAEKFKRRRSVVMHRI